jgi:aryl-alcohol dehydrogenase-like predicted oxidoreductase
MSGLQNHSFINSIELGVGCWQWGDRVLWGYGRGYGDGDVRAAFDASLAANVAFFDTAESYGWGKSERFLGEFVRASGKHVVVATKFMPYPWRLRRGDLLKALRHSLDRLGLKRVDLYQVHWPWPPVSIETWMGAMADAVEAGLARAVGVSNFNVEQTRRAYTALAQRGLRLVSNQVPYSLLNRRVEQSGLLALCQELGVKLIAYSPLEKGVLSGKYSPDNPPPGLRRGIYNRAYMTRIQPLISLLHNIGQARGGKTPAQVALNWLICKGALPIPGAKNAEQAAQNAGAAGWRLTAGEVAGLEAASEKVMYGG